MVIAHKIIEREIGYRGSKSGLYPRPVKEQRVDGSRCVNLTHLRYTLLGFERNSQIKNPSNQIQQRRLYITMAAQQGENQNFKINTIQIYSNIEANKAQILSDNQNKSGIYMFKKKMVNAI